MKTIIAEKPSVAKEIAHIVGADKREEGYMQGNGYYVTWAFGHLVQPAMPETYGMKGFHAENLPVIPDPFVLVPRQVKTEYGYKPDAGVLAQIKIIGKLFDSSERIIVATDAGREGELIFRYLYAYLGCRKPFDRLWISSLTDTAIREGLQNLRDGKEYDNLYHAAKARSEADWLVGINGTQALTIAAGRGTYSVGRVQTPTLGMVCERYWEHKHFESKPFWQVHFGVVDADKGNILKFTSANRWTDKATATAIYNKGEGCRLEHLRQDNFRVPFTSFPFLVFRGRSLPILYRIIRYLLVPFLHSTFPNSFHFILCVLFILSLKSILIFAVGILHFH